MIINKEEDNECKEWHRPLSTRERLSSLASTSWDSLGVGEIKSPLLSTLIGASGRAAECIADE